jgi:hypothetical protein
MSRRLGELPQSIEAFLHAGIYLRNWSPRTVRTYRQGLATLPAELTRDSLTQEKVFFVAAAPVLVSMELTSNQHGG